MYKSSVLTFILKRLTWIFTLSIGVQKILKVSPFIKNENHLLFFVPELKLKIAVRFSICFSTVGKEGVEPTCISAMAFGTIVSTNSTTCPFYIKNETCMISVVTHIKTHCWYHDIPTIRALPSVFTYIRQSSFLPANLGDSCIIGPNLGFHKIEICTTCVVTYKKMNIWLH